MEADGSTEDVEDDEKEGVEEECKIACLIAGGTAIRSGGRGAAESRWALELIPIKDDVVVVEELVDSDLFCGTKGLFMKGVLNGVSLPSEGKLVSRNPKWFS